MTESAWVPVAVLHELADIVAQVIEQCHGPNARRLFHSLHPETRRNVMAALKRRADADIAAGH